MTDQLGNHNASGPLARSLDGTIDPGGYVKSRLGTRRNLALHAVILLGLGVIFLLRGGNGLPFTLALVAGAALLEFAVAFGARFLAAHNEQRRRSAGHAPSWPSNLLAVLQAREAGFDIPSGIRNDSVLRGRLTDNGDRWTWTARSTRTRPERPTIVLSAAWSPSMDHKLGHRHILTFTDQRGARLDFGIGRRRDVLRHL